MTSGPVVCNSSPLIALERLGRLDLLQQLFHTVLIPPAVIAEISPRLALPGWVVERRLNGPVDPHIPATPLGAGEIEAISLSVEINARRVILDDRAARRLAQSRGVPIIGTLGVLLAAKRRGILPDIRSHLDALIYDGFHIGPALYERILSDARELP